MKSLQELSKITLMRNLSSIEDIGCTPFRLIEDVLDKMNKEQLIRLEEKNVFLVLEDDKIWLKFLKLDFPTSVHVSYVSRKEIIYNQYLDFIRKFDEILLNERRQLVSIYLKALVNKDPKKMKFRIPYRILYFKYQNDEMRKQQKTAEKLRLQMQQIKDERERNKTVSVDSVYLQKGRGVKTFVHNKSAFRKNYHSKMFNEAMRGAPSRIQRPTVQPSRPAITRRAFGGGSPVPAPAPVPLVANPAPVDTTTMQQDEPPIKPPVETKTRQVSPVKKRRVESTSIFLTKKKPLRKASTRGPRPDPSSLSSSSLSPPPPSMTQLSSTSKKKKSLNDYIQMKKTDTH
ncbi:hypothetical protein NCAS_0G01340 [Naumovozyma castellii]|uniref:Elongin-A n=1 Tax=Naumovozyma castellii TaxID=27288 RepID=G0VHY7_NAUCA|nr:hypothetical protein NCAS_0G01340 [Naumovozyma castellii CBS 4309]CCC71021.1 hypothetical protein NCAS_0G01340 [Naumovozyma castellii CBS 4309]